MPYVSIKRAMYTKREMYTKIQHFNSTHTGRECFTHTGRECVLLLKSWILVYMAENPTCQQQDTFSPRVCEKKKKSVPNISVRRVVRLN